MKYLIAAILLSPFAAFAQDSCKLRTTQDPYTRQVKISTGFFDMGKAKVSIEATKTEIDFLFSIGSGICFDDQSSAAAYYMGSKVKTNLKNSGTMNCDGLFHLNFKNQANTPTYLQNFSIKLVNYIKVTDNTKKEILLEPTGEQQQIFRRLVACMINESKKLLQ
jgi:hypothetical protein